MSCSCQDWIMKYLELVVGSSGQIIGKGPGKSWNIQGPIHREQVLSTQESEFKQPHFQSCVSGRSYCLMVSPRPPAHPLLKMSFISFCYCLVVSLEGGACCRGQCQQIKNNARLPGDPCVFLGLLLILLMKILIFMNPPKIHTYLTTLGATSCIFISEVPSVPSLGRIQFLSLYHLTSFRR